MKTFERFKEWTRTQVLEEIGKTGYFRGDPRGVTQNDSPTVGTFLGLIDEYGSDNVSFEGYVVRKPRRDFRVSIDGVTVINLTEEEATKLTTQFKGFNARNLDQNRMFESDKFVVYAWWD